ncbi:MAG: hypothetical protein PHN68_12015 [Prolixibacteraceae bacterium]|jgi:hypothetical protein|nr:hypothetical protein [Prolixibacteraceae bacterium]MDD4755762.1 hypothetical protein [Prolixibacteraceae bacterium]NLO03341.1 hypothetical protein [Bacteroidales bacterium]
MTAYESNTFINTNARDIALISHKEPAWLRNIKKGNIIYFYYAFALKAV